MSRVFVDNSERTEQKVSAPLKLIFTRLISADSSLRFSFWKLRKTPPSSLNFSAQTLQKRLTSVVYMQSDIGVASYPLILQIVIVSVYSHLVRLTDIFVLLLRLFCCPPLASRIPIKSNNGLQFLAGVSMDRNDTACRSPPICSYITQ